MGATLTTMNDALKRVYRSDTLEEQIYQGNPLLEKLQGQTQYQAGEVCRVVLHSGRAGGFTALPAGGGNLNTAGNQVLNKADFTYGHFHQPINIQEDALEGTANNAVAVANVLDVEVNGALNDLKKQVTRMLFGNGDSLVTACGTTTTTNVVTLSLTDGFGAIERGWLYPGLAVDIGTASNATSLVNGEAITAVSEVAATPTITVTTSISTTAANFVSVKGTRTGTTSYETNGLRNIVSTSAILGLLDPANAPSWKAANVDTTAQPLTLSLMLQQVQKVNQKTGAPSDTIITGLKQQRKFYELLQQQVRFPSDGSISAGGQAGPKWNEHDVMVHPDCPNEDMYFGQIAHLFPVASRKPFWQNSVTGGNILAWIQGTASYGGKLGYHFNIAADRRNCFARLGGLT